MSFIYSKFMAKIVAACVVAEAATTSNNSLHCADSTRGSELTRSNLGRASGVQALKLSMKAPTVEKYVAGTVRDNSGQDRVTVYGGLLTPLEINSDLHTLSLDNNTRVFKMDGPGEDGRNFLSNREYISVSLNKEGGKRIGWVLAVDFKPTS